MKKYMKPTITVMEVELEAAICAGSGYEVTGASIGGDADPDVVPLSGWSENRSIFADDDE